METRGNVGAPPELLDIGVNLTNSAFDKDRSEVLERAQAAGVQRLIVTGTSERESAAAAELAATRPGILWSTAGVHPHDAKSCTDSTLPRLRDLAARPEVVAIGECGLDFNRDFSPRPTQLSWFEAQVVLAGELAMPLFVHERDAAEATADILSRHRDAYPDAVVHCFTGDGDALDRYLALDLHIGITGWICDERRGGQLHDLIKRIPSHRLVLETDAPYLVPRTLRPKPKKGRNEPAFLTEVLSKVAECLGRPPEQIAAETTETAETLFRL